MSFVQNNDNDTFLRPKLSREISLPPNYLKFKTEFSYSLNTVAIFAVNYIATIKGKNYEIERVEKMMWDKKLKVYEKKHHPILMKFVINKDNNMLADIVLLRMRNGIERIIYVNRVKIDSKSVKYLYLAEKDSIDGEASKILIFGILGDEIVREIQLSVPLFGTAVDMKQNGYSVPENLTEVVRHIELYCVASQGRYVADIQKKISTSLKKAFSKKNSILQKLERKDSIQPKRNVRRYVNSKSIEARTSKSQSDIDFKSKSIDSLLLTNGDMWKMVEFSSIDQKCSSSVGIHNSLSTQSSLNEDSNNCYDPITCRFEDLLYDVKGLKYFKDFLKKEVSSENILFWEAIEEFNKIQDSKWMKIKAAEIFNTFMVEKGANPVNLECEVVENVRRLLSDPHNDMFEIAKNNICFLMKTDSYNRFRKSIFFDMWLNEYKKSSEIKRSTSSNSLTGVHRHKSFFQTIFKNKREPKREDSVKSSPTFDSDCSSSNSAVSTCKIIMSSNINEKHLIQIQKNKKIIDIVKKIDKHFSENDFVAFDLLDDRIVPFSESMLNMPGREIIIERSTIIRVGFVQINMDVNLFEYVWFVIRPRHHLCVSTALVPVAKRMNIDLEKCVVIKEEDNIPIEWNTQIYLLNKCSLFLLDHDVFRKSKLYAKSMTNTLESLWKKMMDTNSFLMTFPFDDENILDSRHEILFKYNLVPRKVGYIISNFQHHNEDFDTIHNRVTSLSYDDQRGICTEEQLAMPDFLQDIELQRSENSSSIDSTRHSEAFFSDIDLSFSEIDEFSDPSPSNLELVSDLE